MPLIQGRSRKAMSENIKTEMEHGKPQKQAIAIAYSVKRKNAKRKAAGGSVQSGSRDMDMAEGGEVSASNEKRPMPENRYNDSPDITFNDHKRNNGEDGWTDTPTEKQAIANNGRMVKPIKRPRMVPTDAFSTRLYDEEGNLQETAQPGPYDAKPASWHDEDGPKRQGPPVSDMEDEHSTHRKPYAKGGQIEPSDKESRNIKMRTSMEPMDDTMEEHERQDEAHLMTMEHPDEMEIGPDRQGPDVPDMEDEHSTGRKPYAHGGTAQYRDAMDWDHDEEMNPAHDKHSEDDSEDQPEDEEMLEKHNSIAAAIMAKKDRRPHQDSDSDMDRMTLMAEGGEILPKSPTKILSHDSIYSDDSDQADLSRNADEDANEEDQLSYNALRKENYSETPVLRQLTNPMDSGEHSDDEEMDSHDKHDMVSSIRRKMNMRRQFRED